ncbi:hypothetical protein ACFLR4_05000, partial [Bacteroidota bacterium]
ITFFVMIILSCNLMGQDKPNIKNKLDSIKGDITKITITTDEGEINFEGKEALLLFKRLKGKDIEMKIFSLDEDADYEFFSESEFSGGEGDIKKKIVKAETIGGELSVTVTTYEKGEKEVKVLEGKEAEKYLEEMKSDGVNIERFNVDGEEDETCIIIDDEGTKKKIKFDEIKCHKLKSDSDSTKVIIMKKKKKVKED